MYVHYFDISFFFNLLRINSMHAFTALCAREFIFSLINRMNRTHLSILLNSFFFSFQKLTFSVTLSWFVKALNHPEIKLPIKNVEQQNSIEHFSILFPVVHIKCKSSKVKLWISSLHTLKNPKWCGVWSARAFAHFMIKKPIRMHENGISI